MLTEHLDLRGGDSLWDAGSAAPASDPLPRTRCDVAVIGAGITGSIVAERLTADGHSVVLLDRRAPGSGSTAASTAQIMWAMDVPLSTLSARIGKPEAARRWRRVHDAVRGFAARLDRLGIAGGRFDCPTLYLEGKAAGAQALREEAVLHRRHGLPSTFFEADAVAERFGIAPRAAIVSEGGYALDPVAVAHALLSAARSRGARVCYPMDVVGMSGTPEGIRLSLSGDERLDARRVVIASGYEQAGMFLPPEFSLLSTFVMATAPDTAPLWRERAMIWEAADPYLYMRADPQGRIIVGGEDETLREPGRRDELVGIKAATIAVKAGALLGTGPLPVERAWAATFGSSPDGLPAIGPAANMPNIWLAAGFGGNGIAFSALASEVLAASFAGTPDPDGECFSPYRF